MLSWAWAWFELISGPTDTSTFMYILLVFLKKCSHTDIRSFRVYRMLRSFRPVYHRLASYHFSSQAAAHLLFDEIPPRETLHAILSHPIAFSKCIALHTPSPPAITQLHALSLTSGLFSQTPVSNSLINAYFRSGHPYTSIASQLFQSAPNRDTVTWNTVISGFGCVIRGVDLVVQMLRGGFTLDATTVSIMLSLSVSSDYSDSLPGFQIHCIACKTGHLSDTVVGNALITFYSRIGFLDRARKVFDEMVARDTVSWNAFLSGFCQEGNYGSHVMPLFLRMLAEDQVRPNKTTVATVVPFCGSFNLGTQLHCLSIKIGVARDLLVSNALMSMYYKNGAVDFVRNVFVRMELRDVVSWTNMISTYPNNAVSLFIKMRQDNVVPNDVTLVALLFAIPENYSVREGGMAHAMCYRFGLLSEVNVLNSVITMYAGLGLMCRAKKVFDGMPVAVRDIISWNALISGHQKNGLCEETLRMFSSLVLHLKPDQYTFGSVLSSISAGDTLSLVFGRICHGYIYKLGLNTNEFVSGGLIDMYAKQGSVEDSDKVFTETINKTVAIWTVIISAHSKHGNYDRVMNLFKNMINSKILPDGITLLAVLMACGLKGEVVTGKKIFDSIHDVYKLEPWPEHYSCMIDMLGKVGRLQEAEKLVQIIPGGPSMSALQSLLSACRAHGDVEMGDRVADLVLRTDPSDSGAYVAISNVYAERGEWENVARIRMEMKENGVKKELGFSWVDLGVLSSLGMYRFSSEDAGHPMAKEIYEIAGSLGSVMRISQEDIVDLDMGINCMN